MYRPSLDSHVFLTSYSCRNCINWRGEKGCHGDIYRHCRGGDPRHKRFFNIDVRKASTQRKRDLTRLYG